MLKPGYFNTFIMYLIILVNLQADIPKMESIVWSDVNLWIAMATIMFNPFYWNVVSTEKS